MKASTAVTVHTNHELMTIPSPEAIIAQIVAGGRGPVAHAPHPVGVRAPRVARQSATGPLVPARSQPASADLGVDYGRAGYVAVYGVEDAGRVLEFTARIAVQRGVIDVQGPAAGIDDEEHGAASLARAVTADHGPVDGEAVVVAVGVDRAAAAASRRAAAGGAGAPADRLVAGHHAGDDGEVGVETAQRGAVGAGVAGERVVRDVDRRAHVHAERADRGTAEVGTGRIAPVVDERRVDDLELAALVKDGAAPVARRAGLLHGRVSILERDVLHDQLWPLLLPAVIRGVLLLRVAGVHVQDPGLAGAVQRDLAAAVEHDPVAGVHDLGRGGHRDRDPIRSAIERDDAAQGHGADHGGGGAAGRRAVPDHVIRVARINGLGRWRDGRVPGQVAGVTHTALVGRHGCRAGPGCQAPRDDQPAAEDGDNKAAHWSHDGPC